MLFPTGMLISFVFAYILHEKWQLVYACSSLKVY